MREVHEKSLVGPLKRPKIVRIDSTSSNASSQHPEGNVMIVEAIDRGFTQAEKLFLNTDQTDKDFQNPPAFFHASRKTPKTLAKQIQDAIPRKKPQFLPQDQFFSLLDEESIYQELLRTTSGSHDHHALRQTAHEVCISVPLQDGPLKSSRRGIFAILCLLEDEVDLLEEICAFLNTNLTDADLPLDSNHQPNTTTGMFDYWRQHDKDKRTCISRPWNDHTTTLFNHFQPMMTAPFFYIPHSVQDKVEVPFFELAETVVLPFIEQAWNEGYNHMGCHGSVRKVQIHPAHHFPSEVQENGKPYFAVKALKPSNQQDLASQYEIISWIEAVGSSDNPHLVRLLAVWRQKETFSLMFPWAGGGNLRDLWISPKIMHRDQGLVEWILEQFIGITNALRRIHRKTSSFRNSDGQTFGVHGDIKPENILWYPGNDEQDLGRLVICDFGFTRFHDISLRSSAVPMGMTSTYRSPEYDCGDAEHRVSPASDMWSLGCVFLEFLTWYVSPSGLVERGGAFATKRVDEEKRDGARGISSEDGFSIPEDKFFRKSVNGSEITVKVKDCVCQWIRDIYAAEGCSILIRELLDLIAEKLLLTDVNERGRQGASDVIVRDLSGMLERCKEYGEAYSLYTCPTPALVDNPFHDAEAVVVSLDQALPAAALTYSTCTWVSHDSGEPSQATRYQGINSVLAGTPMRNDEEGPFKDRSVRASQLQLSRSPVKEAPTEKLSYSEYHPHRKIRFDLGRGGNLDR